MLTGASNHRPPQAKDSFYDDDDDVESGIVPTPPCISSIRIVTSKPPVYRRQSHSSTSPSPSSCNSDHDVTDVSSIGGEHHRSSPPPQQNKPHTFHLQSMRRVLLGSPAPPSRPPSPVDSVPTSTKKHVRIMADDTEKPARPHSHNEAREQQPFVHSHRRDHHHRIRLTSSAINRQKQQQKIEQENLKILQRLHQARPTPSLKREELLSHYDRQMGYITYGAPMPSTPSQPPSRPSSAAHLNATFPASDRQSTGYSRPPSATHSTTSNHPRSRPASATASVQGGSRASSARRPIWNDRWFKQQE